MGGNKDGKSTDENLKQFALKEDLLDMSEAFMITVENLINKMGDKLTAEIKENRRQVKENRRRIMENRKLINDLQVDTPTRQEFTRLEERVERHHPAN